MLQILYRSLLALGFTSISIAANALPVFSEVSPRVTSLKSLGYSRDILLKGVNPKVNFSVKNPAGGVAEKDSFLSLSIKASPFLDAKSSVRILINEEPVLATSVEALRKTPLLKIPLTTVPKNEPFISVSLESYLFVDQQDVCESLQSGNLYLVVDNDSSFQVKPQIEDKSINGFFTGTYQQVILTVPDNLEAAQLESALWLYGLLSGQFGKRNIPVLWHKPDNEIPANSAQVILDADFTGENIERQGATLKVHAVGEVVKGLAIDARGLPFSSQQTAIESALYESSSLSSDDQRIAFRQLGFNSSPRRGSGLQRFRINFDLAQLGTRPQELALSLKSLFTPVDHKDGDRLNGQIYLNNTLVSTYNLSEKTDLSDTLFLPTKNLRRTNNLDVVFEHNPSQGGCLASAADLTFQVSEDSYLAWNGEQEPQGTFNDLPYNFLDKGRMVVDVQRPELIQATAYLLGMLNQMSPGAIFPKLVSGKDAEQLTERMASAENQSDWQILALPPEQFPQSAPIRLGEAFEIINPLNRQVILSTRPKDSLGLLQYFSHQSRPTLGLSWWGNDSTRITQLAALLANPRRGLAQTMEGNVVSTNSLPNDVQSWDLSGKSLQVNYPESLHWSIWISRYRSLLLFLAALVGGGLCWFLYKKLGRLPQSQTAINDTSSPPPTASEQDGEEQPPEAGSSSPENGESSDESLSSDPDADL